MSDKYAVGQRVQFRAEWPFTVHTGTVTKVENRKREFGDGMEVVVTVKWDDDCYGGIGGNETAVQAWNQRLQPITKAVSRG